MKKTILLAGGGTAGHVNPLLALADELQSEYEVVVLGTSAGLEQDLVPKAGYQLLEIPRIPLPRKPSPQIFSFPFRLLKTVRKVRGWLREHQVCAVVGFGGYVSPPAYLAARAEGVPVVIHEQNARPGIANRLGARWANVLALTFSQTSLKAKHGKTKVVGLPLRKTIKQLLQGREEPIQRAMLRSVALAHFGLKSDFPVLLVTGGSLGAQQLNSAFIGALPELPEDIQVVHLTGKGKSESVLKAVEAIGSSLPQRYRVLEYLDEMELALAVADLVVCRAGAGTVAELSALGIPAIYVPLAIGNGEQRFNAAAVVADGGAILVDNQNFTSSYIVDSVLPLLKDDLALQKMGERSAKHGHPKATEYLANLVREVIE